MPVIRELDRRVKEVHPDARVSILDEQGRVHMAHMGHPLLGDVVYGSKKPWPGLAGQCLHARRLSFIHPRTGERMTLECPLPQWFQDVLTKLGRLV